MDADLKKSLDETIQATNALREKVDKYGENSAEVKSFIENAETRFKSFEEFEKKNSEVVKNLEAEKKANEELLDRVKGLENNIALTSGHKHGDSGDQMKAESEEVMNAFLKGQVFVDRLAATPEGRMKFDRVMKSLSKGDYMKGDESETAAFSEYIKSYGEKASADFYRPDVNEFGGFLVPPEWSRDFAKVQIEHAPLRSMCRVRTTGSQIFKEPQRLGIGTAVRPGLGRSSGDNTSNNYGMIQYIPTRLTSTYGVTRMELMTNQYNLSSEIKMDSALAFAVIEGQEFFNGAGGEEFQGWSTDGNVPQVQTATNSLVADDIIGMGAHLKKGYNPMYMFNRRVGIHIRTLKDGQNRYLWNPAYGDFAAGAPATINGYRYNSDFIEFDDADTANGFPILFADMSQFYQIVDHTGMVIITDEVTRKKEGVIEFTTLKYCTGRPRLYEAGVRLQKIA